MAEKFGLDWREYQHERMIKFVEIMTWEAEREKRNADKANKNKATKTHLR